MKPHLLTLEVDAAHTSEGLHLERVVRSCEVGPPRLETPLNGPQWQAQLPGERPGIGVEPNEEAIQRYLVA